MPPTTASSRLSLATRRWVSAKRFITLALSNEAGWVIWDSRREDLAAGEERREDEAHRRLGGDRLLDAAVDDELGLVEPGHRMGLDAERAEHRPHGLCHHGLAEVELAERAALGHEHDERDLVGHRERGEHVRDGGEAAGLHQHGAAPAAHPGAGENA